MSTREERRAKREAIERKLSVRPTQEEGEYEEPTIVPSDEEVERQRQSAARSLREAEERRARELNEAEAERVSREQEAQRIKEVTNNERRTREERERLIKEAKIREEEEERRRLDEEDNVEDVAREYLDELEQLKEALRTERERADKAGIELQAARTDRNSAYSTSMELSSLRVRLARTEQMNVELTERNNLLFEDNRILLDIINRNGLGVPEGLKSMKYKGVFQTTPFNTTAIDMRQKLASRLRAQEDRRGNYKMEVEFDDQSFTVPHVKAIMNPETQRVTYATLIDNNTPHHYINRSSDLRKDTIYSHGKMRILLKDANNQVVSEDSGTYNANPDDSERGYVMRTGNATVYANNIGDDTLKLHMIAIDV